MQSLTMRVKLRRVYVGLLSVLRLGLECRWRETAPRVARAILDVEFDLRSPLSQLDSDQLPNLGGEFVSLPPLHLFDRANQDPAGLARLITIAKALDARRIFEIGTHNGLTALALAANLPAATIETLDIPPGVKPVLPLAISDPECLGNFKTRYFDGRPEAGRIIQHLSDSATFDYADLQGSFDLVYVDGGHSREYLENDTRLAFAVVKATGAILWDDYQRGYPSVSAQVDQISGDRAYRLRDTRIAAWFTDDALRRLGIAAET